MRWIDFSDAGQIGWRLRKREKQIPACHAYRQAGGRQASPPFAKTATGLGMTICTVGKEIKDGRADARTDLRGKAGPSPPFAKIATGFGMTTAARTRDKV
jgi:hypothetical protein